MAEAVSDLSRATGDISLYGNALRGHACLWDVFSDFDYPTGYYLRSVGLRNFLILLACTSSYSFFVTFPQYWLQKWTESPASQTMFYVGGYLILSLMAWTSTNGSMWQVQLRLLTNMYELCYGNWKKVHLYPYCTGIRRRTTPPPSFNYHGVSIHYLSIAEWY